MPGPRNAPKLVVLRLPESHWYIETLNPSVPGVDPIDHLGTPVPEDRVEAVKENAEREGILLLEGAADDAASWVELERE